MKPEYVQMIKSIVYDVEIHSNEILIDQGHQIWQIIQKQIGGKGFIDFVKVLIENCSSVKMIESYLDLMPWIKVENLIILTKTIANMHLP